MEAIRIVVELKNSMNNQHYGRLDYLFRYSLQISAFLFIDSSRLINRHILSNLLDKHDQFFPI